MKSINDIKWIIAIVQYFRTIRGGKILRKNLWLIGNFGHTCASSPVGEERRAVAGDGLSWEHQSRGGEKGRRESVRSRAGCREDRKESGWIFAGKWMIAEGLAPPSGHRGCRTTFTCRRPCTVRHTPWRQTGMTQDGDCTLAWLWLLWRG